MLTEDDSNILHKWAIYKHVINILLIGAAQTTYIWSAPSFFKQIVRGQYAISQAEPYKTFDL